MAKTYRKNILRTFKSTRSRFLSIFSIVALGVGFLAGLSATPVDMETSMEKYMDNGNFYDLRILSTLGLTDGDVEALRAVEGVREVQPGHSADLLVQAGEADVIVARAHDLPAEDGINRLVLEEGRLPAAPGECVVEAGSSDMTRGFRIGDTFVVTEDNDDLEDTLGVTEFTVVGTVHNSNYFSYEREPASVGNGTIGVVFYILPEDFAFEVYTEIYVTCSDVLELDSRSDEYEAAVDAVAERIEGIADVRCQARYDEVRAEADEELADARQELADARAEAETELADAWQEIQDGKQELADGEAEYYDGLAEYQDGKKELEDGIAALDSAYTQLAEGQAAYDDGWRQITDAEQQLAEGKAQLEDGQRQYEEGKAAYDAAEVQYGELVQLQAGLRQYDAAIQQIISQSASLGQAMTYEQAEATFSDDALHSMRSQLDSLSAAKNVFETKQQAQTAYENAYAASTDPANDPAVQQALGALQQAQGAWLYVLAQSTPGLDLSDAQAVQQAETAMQAQFSALPAYEQQYSDLTTLNRTKSQLDTAVDQIAQAQGLDRTAARALILGDSFLPGIRFQLDDTASQLEAAKAELDAGWAAYEENGTTLYDTRNQLIASKKTLDENWALLADKQLELQDAKVQLADAEAELADARQTLADARQELLDGETDYADAKAEVEQELADAEQEIADAEAEIADLELPEWYVWDRSQNVSFASFDSNVEKLTAITTVFPIFFFLVAALVVSTTMTRMIEEERLHIGTMKALGYTRGEIVQKYLWYALVAAVAGTFVGLAVGFVAFPTIIWTAYGTMYYMPHIYTPWLLENALFAGGALIALTLVVTVAACRVSLSEAPAALMLPRAPKAGKRILLERIGPLWRRLPFTWKVTCRNLLRYKKRFWMTVIGVAGCTALLVTGFGISDSLNSIIVRQFEDVYHYDLMTAVKSAADTECGEVHDYLFGENFTASLVTSTEKTTQHKPDETKVEVYLMVPQDLELFRSFADLHERLSGEAVPLGEDGVVLTEKFASIMGVEAGDTIALENADGETAEFPISGVCEHYVYNYVYLSPSVYEAGFGTAPEWNAVLTQLPENTQEARDRISAVLLDMDAVAGVNFTTDQIDMVLNMLNAIDAVVVLIIVCAAALALVVLYNLTNINIAERVKEIATIKVLGFYEKEVNAYVNRESVSLTVIGAFVGMFLGIWLHQFIIVTVEVDAVMFGREIEWTSFLYAAVLTLVFGGLVNLMMGKKLKNISMVESMKAPE